jgi:hypothetical protein
MQNNDTVREHPIIFSGAMVRAILDGRKVQTRRVVKPQPDCVHDGEPYWKVGGYRALRHREAPDVLRMGCCKELACPYGVPGDALWVKETWAHYHTVNYIARSDGRAFDEVSDGLCGYRADGHDTIEDFRRHIQLMAGYDLCDVIINGDRWRSSRYMPRWASRITLRVDAVRVQRVQDITPEDCWAEGIPVHPHGDDGYKREWARTDYFNLWDSINAARGFPVVSNPWVWAITFSVQEVAP